MLQAAKNNTVVKMSPLGEAGILVSFGEDIDPATHDKVHAFAQYLEQNPFAGMLEYTEAFTSVTVYYDIVSLQNYKIEVVNQQQSYAFQAAEAILRNILPQVNFSGAHMYELCGFPSAMGVSLVRILGRWQLFIACRHSK